LVWTDGTEQEQGASHQFDNFLGYRPKDNRTPSGNSVGRDDNHVDVLAFDHDHEVPRDIIANLNARTSLDSSGNHGGNTRRHAPLSIRTQRSKQRGIVKLLRPAGKFASRVHEKHRNNVHKVKRSLKMLAKIGRYLKRGVG
jgi:hypothetical protein